MSKTVDQRVVEMRFDNREFEKNVKTSMNSLERLKQSLNFKGATKGVENLSTATKNVNMNALGTAVESVRMKFSALEVMGVTALANITNQAVNAGKRFASAFTIDPLKTGFQEYETQINAVQTILANTSSKGTDLDDVNAALDTLNTYADKTIYNFTEMTRNIGTFTAAGVDLDTSVNAIQGIANLAAVSGSTSQQASTAMYQLSQALASGTVKLMDWNSVVNAGMGGEVFQDALKETARVHGIAIDEMIKNEGSFRETLSEGWLTSEILTETLQKFTLTTEGLTAAEIERNREMLKAKGYTEKQIDDIFKLGKTATDAATKVKTFSQLFDTLKEAAQSGWTQTWELIVGDFEESKEFLTGLSDMFGEFINASSEARNNLLSGALSSKWEEFTKKINKAGISTEDFTKKLRETGKEGGISISGLIKRYGSLERAFAAGAIPTKLVTKTLNKFAGEASSASKSTEELDAKLKEFQQIVDDVWRGDYGDGEDRVQALTKAGYDYAKVQKLVNKAEGGRKITLEDLSEAELVAIGYTKDEAKAIRDLAKEAQEAGTPLNELVENLGKPSGRQLLIDSFKNALSGIVSVLSAVKKAWVNVFPPMTSQQLYGIIEAVNAFSQHLIVGDKTAENLTRTFKGVFALLDIILTLVTGPIKLVVDGVMQVIKEMNIDILHYTAILGDGIVAVRDWVDQHNIFVYALKAIIPYLKKAFYGVREWIEGFGEAEDIPKYIIEGFVNGLKNGARLAVDCIIALAKMIKSAFTGEFRIESPSKWSFEQAKYIIQGLINGLKEYGSMAVEAIKNVFSKIFEWVQKIDFGKVFAVFLAVGLIVVAKKFADVAAMFVNPLSAIADALEGVGKMLGAIAFDKRASGMLKLAGAIAILAASIALLTLVDPVKLAIATVAVGGIITAMIFLMNALNKMKVGTSVVAVSLAAVIASIVMLVLAIQMLANIRIDDPLSTIVALVGIVGALVVLMVACSKLSKTKTRTNVTMRILRQLTVTLLLLVGIVKLASMLSVGEVFKGTAILSGMALFILALSKIMKVVGKGYTSNFGSNIRSIVISLALLVGVVKLVQLLKVEEVLEAMVFMTTMSLFFLAMAAVSKLAGSNASEFGGAMLKLSLALIALVGVCKLAGMLSVEDIKKSLPVLGVLGALTIGLVAVSHLAGKHASKAGSMLIKLAVAFTILSAVAFLIGQIDPKDLTQGLIGIYILSACVAGMIAVTKLANVSEDLLKTLTRFAVIIGIMGGLVIALSFLDPTRVMTASGAISMIVSSLALLVMATKFSKNTKELYRTLWQMTAIIGILAAIVVGLSFIDGNNALKSAAALSAVMLAFAGALVIASHCGRMSKTLMPYMVAMSLIVGLFGTVFALMSHLNTKDAIQNAVALSIFTNALAASLVILSKAKSINAKAVGALTIFAVVAAGIGAALAGIEALGGISIETATSLSLFLLAIASVLPTLVTIGQLGPAALKGAAIGALALGAAALIVEVAAALAIALAELTGWLMGFITPEAHAQTMKGLDYMIDILEKIAYGVGSAIGNFISGFGTGLLAGIPDMLDTLHEMMEGIKELAEEAKTIDASSLSGIKTMAEILLILAGTDMISSMNKLLGQGLFSSLFGPVVSAAVTKGTSSTNAMSQLGKIAKDFAEQTKDLEPGDIERIKLGAEAIKVLAEATATLPKQGGLAGGIFGDIQIGSFGTGLTDAAAGIKEFADKCSSFTESTVTHVQFGADAITAIAKAAQDIPNTGGFAAEWSGDNTIGEFCAQLSVSADGVIDFANKITGAKFNKDTVKTVGYGVQAMAVIAKEAANIPNTGGLAGLLAGENDIGQFCAQLPGVATNLKSFAVNLGTFTPDNVKSVEQVVIMINSFSELSTNISSLATYLEVISRDLNDFANGIKGFVGTMNEIGSPNIATAVTNTKMIISAIDTLKNTSAGHVEELGSAMSVFASKGVQSFVKALTNTDSISKCKDAGSKMASSAIQGVKDRMNAKIDSIESVGKSFAEGFKKGMESQKGSIWDAAVALAEKAINAVKSATDTNSPSRVAFELGGFFGVGFTNGIIDNVKDSAVAGETIANSARQGVVDALKTANALMADELNVQPTIRPVIDLSDVKTGVGAISSLLDLSPSAGILANVGAINASMSQNGTDFDDVIDAIRELRDDIKNMKTVVNQIDGVTYDDGSNIADAIEQIVRAVITERRR